VKIQKKNCTPEAVSENSPIGDIFVNLAVSVPSCSLSPRRDGKHFLDGAKQKSDKKG
jgi:hypothetical protein